MSFMTKIHFSGLMVFLTNENPVKVIIPKVKGRPPFDDHVAYIAYRKGKGIPSSGWTPTPFLPNQTEFLMVHLDGDETITLNQGGSPLQFGDFLPHLKYKYCNQLENMKDEYKSGTSAARVILRGGDNIGWHVTDLKRIETIVSMHDGQYPFTLTATNAGGTKTLTFKGEANIVIGNSDKKYIDEPAKQFTQDYYDFLFYYEMFKEHLGCNSSPTDPPDADGNPNDKDPVVEIPPITGAIDIACSNSQYP